MITTQIERVAMNIIFNAAKVMVCSLSFCLVGKSHTLILATIAAEYTYTGCAGEVLAIVSCAMVLKPNSQRKGLRGYQGKSFRYKQV